MDLADLVGVFLPMVEAIALTVARPLGFLTLFPIFNWMGLQGMIRNVIALALGSPFIIYAYVGVTSVEGGFPFEMLAVLVAKEFLLGVLLGAALGAPFWAAETAGAYIDVYRGTSAATVMGPGMLSETLISGAIFTLALIAIFLAAGGLRVVVGALHESYQFWRLFDLAPSLSEPSRPIVIALLAEIAKLALALGAPLLIAMFLGEMTLALSSRFAQQINVFDATLSAKNLIFLAIMPPYLYLLVRYYGPDVLDLDGLLEIVSQLFEKDSP